MKIAARFPVKDCLSIKWTVLLAHLGLLIFSWILLVDWWASLLVSFAAFASYVVTLKQYKLFTNADDDLCWNGEYWLMDFVQYKNNAHQSTSANAQGHSKNEEGVIKSPRALVLSDGSWVTSTISLLHFYDGEKTHYWLFTRNGLGERLYSELVYLVSASIRTNADVK